MPRSIERKVAEAIELLHDFESALQTGTLRAKVLKLVGAFKAVQSVGNTLDLGTNKRSARDRMLAYMLHYPKTAIHTDELMVVAGISEYARRLRELRVQFGWQIVSGKTLNEMKESADSAELSVLSELPDMKATEYILIDEKQDRDSAFRWNQANEIRKETGLSVRDRILKYLRLNVGSTVSGEELRYVAKEGTEWARRVRELRTEEGWPVSTRSNGRPEMPVGFYLLESDRQSPPHDRSIKDSTRRSVYRRDGYRCQYPDCGWSPEEWNRSDPRHLEAHHIEAHANRGSNEADNLITYCNICHDIIHSKQDC